MRVLHFYKTYLPDSIGGTEQVIFQLCESGANYGIDGQVLTLSPPLARRDENRPARGASGPA